MGALLMYGICYTLTCGLVFTPNAVRGWQVRADGREGVGQAATGY